MTRCWACDEWFEPWSEGASEVTCSPVCEKRQVVVSQMFLFRQKGRSFYWQKDKVA